jgi:hypothetical protein
LIYFAVKSDKVSYGEYIRIEGCMGIKNKFSYIMINWLNMVIYIRDYRTDTCSLYFGYARDTHDT